MPFTLSALSFDIGALEPHIDAQTMSIHHSKHHQKYVTTLNGAIDKVGSGEIPSDLATTVRNNAGGHWNHTFFWTVLGAPSNTNGPSAELKAAIDKAFGSMDEMQGKFNAAAAGRFGSGWAWLGVDASTKDLVVTSTANQDNPLMSAIVGADACVPVLGLDVWEHAYYLKYQNRRPDYISAFWSVVNWDAVNGHYANATAGKAPKL